MPTLLGIPLDVNSSYLRGPSRAPAKIREALRSDASNNWSELGVDVGAPGAFADAVLDPAFAPGISHREPGGMTVREAIAHLHAIQGAIVGADIVEYNPEQDVSGMTATVAAKILREILGKLIAA